MKKNLIFLAFFAFVATTNAQVYSKIWTKLCNGTDFSWFNNVANINNAVGMAYNPATNKLLISSRNSQIYILNASTGAQDGTLNITGVGTESFKFNKIRVDADGAIYGISLLTAAGTCKIYRWASQTATPTLCASFTTTERCGDAFALSGSGVNTVLYASGAGVAAGGNTKIYVLTTTDGASFTQSSVVNTTSSTAQWANRSIDPIGATPTDGLWVDMSGGPGRRLSITGTEPTFTASVGYATGAGTGNGQVADAYCGMRYFKTADNLKFLGFTGANNIGEGPTFRLLNVTNEAAVTTYGNDTLYNGATLWTYQTNTNGTGEVAFKNNNDGTYDIFYLVTNNGISCIRTVQAPLPVELVEWSGAAKNNQTELKWQTASETNSQSFDIERSRDGKNFTKIGNVKAQGKATNYMFIDPSPFRNTNYYRLKMVDNDETFGYSKIISIQNGDRKTTIKIYPTVTQDVISVENDGAAVDFVTVFNLVGQVQFTEQATNRIDLSHLPSGVYLVQVQSGSEKVTEKVFKR